MCPLKKIVSIALLLLFTFNLGGYYFLFWVLKSEADQQLAQKLEQSTALDGTYELKIPLSLPYPLQQTGFENRDGELVYKNEHFRLVKQKYENDTLTIICLKDQESRHLAEAMDAFSSKASGEPSSSDGVSFSGKVLQEYEPSLLPSLVHLSGWYRHLDKGFPTSGHLSVILSAPSPPPRA